MMGILGSVSPRGTSRLLGGGSSIIEIKMTEQAKCTVWWWGKPLGSFEARTARSNDHSKLSARGCPPSCGTRVVPPRSDALQENTGGLVVGVSRDQLAAECLGEDGLVELVNELAGAS